MHVQSVFFCNWLVCPCYSWTSTSAKNNGQTPKPESIGSWLFWRPRLLLSGRAQNLCSRRPSDFARDLLESQPAEGGPKDPLRAPDGRDLAA